MANNGDRSFAGVLEDVVSNVQDIVRSEVRLAKAEIREETAKAGKAVGMLGSGALLTLYACGFLLLAGFFALEIVFAPWLASLIVALTCGIVAALLILLGRKRMKGVHPRPDQTIRTLKENLEWAKHRTR